MKVFNAIGLLYEILVRYVYDINSLPPTGQNHANYAAPTNNLSRIR